MDTCIECGAEDAPEGALYCEDCDVPQYEDLECSVCGHEFNTADGGEYDTCGACLDEIDAGVLAW
jgi:hypothetical protein